MLTIKGSVLCEYLKENMDKKQLEAVTAFLVLVSGLRFTDFEQAMNYVNLDEFASIFKINDEAEEEEFFKAAAEATKRSHNVEAGVTFTLKLKDETDEDMKILFRDILRDGRSFFQTIDDLNLSSADYIITKKIL